MYLKPNTISKYTLRITRYSTTFGVKRAVEYPCMQVLTSMDMYFTYWQLLFWYGIDV
jgi:hypothetical protein